MSLFSKFFGLDDNNYNNVNDTDILSSVGFIGNSFNDIKRFLYDFFVILHDIFSAIFVNDFTLAIKNGIKNCIVNLFTSSGIDLLIKIFQLLFLIFICFTIFRGLLWVSSLEKIQKAVLWVYFACYITAIQVGFYGFNPCYDLKKRNGGSDMFTCLFKTKRHSEAKIDNKFVSKYFGESIAIYGLNTIALVILVFVVKIIIPMLDPKFKKDVKDDIEDLKFTVYGKT